MNRHSSLRSQPVALFALASLFAGAGFLGGQEPKILQPGAPGEPSREITAEEASDLAGILVTEADVQFMQGMIVHHAQALEMTALVEERSESPDLRTLAQRIELSQEDESRMMEDWLAANATETTNHDHDGHERMPGMATAAEMERLAEARAGDFDRLFLELMIAHHQGALVMVDDLLAQPGSAQESAIFGFTNDVTADQSMEIDRMGAMLAEWSSDPRVSLAAGYLDAEEAISNLALLAALPKPAGFFSPENPDGFAVPAEDDEEGNEEDNEDSDDSEDSDRDPEKADPGERAREGALLSFSNSDLAFAGDLLFEGNFHGFNIYDIASPSEPRLVSSVVCPGGQGDLSVIDGDLLVMSVEQTRGRLDCGLQGVADPASAARFRGVRIFDISDPARPRQVAAVQTCRGSHTHSVVSSVDDEGNVYVYGSGTGPVRPGEELEGCSDAHPGEDESTALFSIDVIQIPIANPEASKVVNRPRVFADPESGKIAGLWKGGDHGQGTQKTSQTNQCHDITIFPEHGLAAGACSGNGILFDITDPVYPVRLDHVVDPGFAYWHSATFNNDGTKVLFTDEWGGGMRPRCRASDPKNWGANAIYDIENRRLEYRSHYKLPAPQTEVENCVAHNGSLVPVPGRDIMVQAWYQGGLSVFDFTDSTSPIEIAFFDRGPVDPDELKMGGYWSTYWYRGHIYGTEIARGLDVLALTPSEHLTRNEIDAASLVMPSIVNAQYQEAIEWPAHPVVARAYLDQMKRGRQFGDDAMSLAQEVIDRAGESLADGSGTDSATADDLEALAISMEEARGRLAGADRDRALALAGTARGLAEQLR